jgi:DHA1 family bicyclomycin/chloramphenicol resistance-like MFS transporter
MKYKLDIIPPRLIYLILLIGFPSAATVLISPALPAISHFFNVSKGYTQQLITIFVIGYALGQLIYPPFANRFGRKIAIVIGMSIYLFGCLICLAGIYLYSIEIIFLGRFLMALGASVGMVISFTIINDYYHPEQARKIVSYTVLAYAFTPALAVALGGFITAHLSWIDCFYFYLLYGIIVLISSMYLPETLKNKNYTALQLRPIFYSFYQALKTWKLVLFSVIYGLMSAFIYIIASDGPFIGINHIGLSAAQYGILLLIPYSGQFIGALSAGYFSTRLSAYAVLALGYSFVMLGSLLMLISFIFHWINIFSFLIPIFFIMMGLPMTYSTSTVMALADYEDKATGSAMMGFITMFISLIAIFVLSLIPSKNPLVMPVLFSVILFLAVIAFWHARKHFN